MKRGVDTLAVMERRGSITAGMRQAGERFRAVVSAAARDPLHASDLERILSNNRFVGRISGRSPASRQTVRRVIDHLGGVDRPAGSILFHVVGLEQSVKEWAAGHGRSQETAAGILIAALSVLEGLA